MNALHFQKSPVTANDSVPSSVRGWLAQHTHGAEDLISMAGPNRHIDAVTGGALEKLFVDDTLVGYAAHYRESSVSFAAVFDSNGAVVDARTIVK
jgi:hypothetical protein